MCIQRRIGPRIFLYSPPVFPACPTIGSIGCSSTLINLAATDWTGIFKLEFAPLPGQTYKFSPSHPLIVVLLWRVAGSRRFNFSPAHSTFMQMSCHIECAHNRASVGLGELCLCLRIELLAHPIKAQLHRRRNYSLRKLFRPSYTKKIEPIFRWLFQMILIFTHLARLRVTLIMLTFHVQKRICLRTITGCHKVKGK